MAKELPYFQFEPAEYLTKDISFCSLSAQGLFTNICSYYWQRECKLTKDQLLRRLNYINEFDELIDEGIIDLAPNGNDIKIKFLDVQYKKATKQSETNSINGSKGGRPKKEKPNESETKPKLNPNESKTKGIREDKIIEDNIKKDYSKELFFEDWNELRKEHLKKPSFIKSMSSYDLAEFKELKKAYTRDEFRIALIGLFRQKKMPNDITSMQTNPTHFLKFFNSYITAGNDKDSSIYGKTSQE